MASGSKTRWRREIEALAKEMGWQVETTRGSHIRLTKGAHVVVTSGSPRNTSRTLANTMAEMKRRERNDPSRVLQHPGL